LHFITWGGGGWGDPLERDPELVAKEIVQGLLTPEGARAYGVVITPDGSIDTPATDTLRKTIRDERGTVQVFDFGPSIDTLRTNCEKETGLPAPRQKMWEAVAEAAE
ncbi:hydantoinase B/oxoprolinase family protein, partial [Altererythrobacter sp. C41]|nr:hydantoinase B/oxoprolinase family protein [Altererythrobacter sp. C41]